MAKAPGSDTDQLLERIRDGDETAVGDLFVRHRDRLKRMVAARMDDRLRARVDPSDVVQDAFAAATEQLTEFLSRPPEPFYPWLRQIAWNRLIDLFRHHIMTERRAVEKEQPLGWSDASAALLADQLIDSQTGPVSQVLRAELRTHIKAKFSDLKETDREILILRHLERLSISECAPVLKITKEAAKKRYLRALQRLRKLLSDELGGSQL